MSGRRRPSGAGSTAEPSPSGWSGRWPTTSICQVSTPPDKHFCTSANFHDLHSSMPGLDNGSFLSIIILKTALLNFTADNVKVSRDGSIITIVNVQPENHGPYRCVASNPFGITHTIVSVIVKGKKAQERVSRRPRALRVELPLLAEPCSCSCVLRLSCGRRHPRRTRTGQAGRTHQPGMSGIRRAPPLCFMAPTGQQP